MSDFSDSDCEISQNDADNKFNNAANYVQEIHNKLLPNDLLELYALYKQATTGSCNIPKPGVFSMQARAKWNAWNNLGSMSAVDAKHFYVEKVSHLDPKWLANQQANPKWVVHSTPMPPEDLETENKTVFDYVKDKNFSKVKDTIERTSPSFLDTHDDFGLGLIHWASDRNSADILEFLLDSGANVNLQDSEGQTALHYAASCGHIDCVRVLLKFGADKGLSDNDGQTASAVCVDEEYIRKLLETN